MALQYISAILRSLLHHHSKLHCTLPQLQHRRSCHQLVLSCRMSCSHRLDAALDQKLRGTHSNRLFPTAEPSALTRLKRSTAQGMTPILAHQENSTSHKRR